VETTFPSLLPLLLLAWGREQTRRRRPSVGRKQQRQSGFSSFPTRFPPHFMTGLRWLAGPFPLRRREDSSLFIFPGLSLPSPPLRAKMWVCLPPHAATTAFCSVIPPFRLFFKLTRRPCARRWQKGNLFFFSLYGLSLPLHKGDSLL